MGEEGVGCQVSGQTSRHPKPDTRNLVNPRPSSAPPELLAPAGGLEQACAALHYGADAIYCGLPRFSARADAENFTWDSLRELVAFAHGLSARRRVYVAFNTLLLERELPDAAEALQRLQELGVDAVIVQDLGVARLARLHFPGLRLHASTQSAVHSVEGARALRELGFVRVVLAREVSLAEVGAIARESGLEVETFVHGALCYSYSGLCVFSSHATGRSGNRGRCASCCREAFRGDRDETFAFSMKDLALGRRISELRATGARALKIEGRLKGPLYVAAVTDYYRRLLDGRLGGSAQQQAEENLRTIFSRPWTELYAVKDQPVAAVIDADTMGHRGTRIGEVRQVRRERDGDWLHFRSDRALERHDGIQVDVPGQDRPFGFALDALRASGTAGDLIRSVAGREVAVLLPPDHPLLPVGAPVYCSSSQEVKRSFDFDRPRPGSCRVRHPLSVTARLRADALVLRGAARVPGLPELAAEVRLPGPFSPARTPEGTAAALQKTFDRLGDTDWAAADVQLDDPDHLFVPASGWNEGRRQLVAALNAARDTARAAALQSLPGEDAEPDGAAGETWSLRLDDLPQGWGEDADELVLPLSAAAEATDPRVRIALPVILRGPEAAALRDRVAAVLAQGQRRWEVASLAGWQILREAAAAQHIAAADLQLTADWSVYTMNRRATAALCALGFQRGVSSPEEDRANLLARLAAAPGCTEVLLLQFTPLFLSETAPALAGHHLKGRRGERYVDLEQDHLHVLIAERPYSIAGQLAELRAAGGRHFRVDLSRAAAAGADPRAIWTAARAGADPAGSHRGNYQRGLQ
jgi:putative protease